MKREFPALLPHRADIVTKRPGEHGIGFGSRMIRCGNTA